MQYNDIIKKQLEDYVKVPAVLMTKEEVPYEYKNGGSNTRLKRRRDNDDIPLELFHFVLANRISKDILREFSSGLFLNYVDLMKVYG